MREKVKEVSIIKVLPIDDMPTAGIDSAAAKGSEVKMYDEKTPYRNCHCTDASIVPVIATRKPGQKWQLFGISEVQGMGNASHEKNLFGEEYDEIVPLNSMKGLSYILFRQGEKWGVIQIRDNRKIECEIKKLSQAKFESEDEVLRAYNISRGDFR